MLLTFPKIWVGYLGQDVLRIVFFRFWPVMLDKTHSLKLVPFWIPSKPFYFCISLSFPVSFQKCNISSSALEGTCVDSLILYLLLLVLHFLFDLLRFYFAVVKMAHFLSPLMLIEKSPSKVFSGNNPMYLGDSPRIRSNTCYPDPEVSFFPTQWHLLHLIPPTKACLIQTKFWGPQAAVPIILFPEWKLVTWPNS